MEDVAQLVAASGCGPEGRGFESHHSPQKNTGLFAISCFLTKSTLEGGLNRIHDEIPLVWDEIRLDGGWVDLISSKHCLDFICLWQISSRSDFILAFS